MKPRILAMLLGALLAGACAHHQQAGVADPGTSERWERIMRQMRADSAERAARETGQPARKASGVDSDPASLEVALPEGVDVASFELPIHYNERVQEYLDLFGRRRNDVFAAWLRRMGRYRAYVEERLAAHGMPRELVYLPLIESGYETTARSNASAVGIWQFMSGTARSEGLEVSEYVDERRDPFRSTDAALRHLAGLYHQFGSWYLAAAAYNSGSGRIARLLKEYGRRKGPDEVFWEVQHDLPAETRGYVPGLIAAAIIGENPHLFGFEGISADAPVTFGTVTVPGATELRAVARAAGVSTDEIKALNPHLLRGITPPGHRTEVRVPPASTEGFAAAFARIPADERTRALTSTHIVRRGETLSEIADRYGVTVAMLQKLNHIKRPHLVRAGRKLVVPTGVRSGAD